MPFTASKIFQIGFEYNVGIYSPLRFLVSYLLKVYSEKCLLFSIVCCRYFVHEVLLLCDIS